MKKEPTLEQKIAKLEEEGDPLVVGVVGDDNPLPSLKSIESIDDHKVLLDICKRFGLPTSGNAAQKRKAICDQITPTCLIRQLGSRDCNLVNKARTHANGHANVCRSVCGWPQEDQITPTCLIRQLGSRDCNLVNKARTQCKRACKCVPIRMRMAARGPNHTDLPN